VAVEATSAQSGAASRRRLGEYEPEAESDLEAGPMFEPPLLEGDDPGGH
jgi:hypothetical protein